MRQLRKTTIAQAAAATALLVLALAAGCRPLGDVDDTEARPTAAATEAHPSFVYGRVTAVDGATYEGRLRFGGDEETFWGDYFNGFKDGNPWVDQVPPGELPGDGPTIRFLGIKLVDPGRPVDLRRQLLVRFGDIAKIDARWRELRVTLKSGTVVLLDRWSADDFADGVRVWDPTRGVVDLGERRIRTIEFLAPRVADAAAPYRLHGKVRTRHGEFTGFLEWNRRGSIGLDELTGHAPGGELLSLPFITIRSIERRSSESSRVTLLDGREIVLSGTRDVGDGHRGIYVDDARYGRVLVAWDAFDRVDFTTAGTELGGGPAYDDFPPGRRLTGNVTTRDGRHLAGRIVYDLDESEGTQTLDAPSEGVDYTIPFGLVTSIVLPGRADRAPGGALVTLRSGEELQLERAGDLGAGNAGLLIFADGRERPEYVPWDDVERVDFEPPPAVYPPVEAARTSSL